MQIGCWIPSSSATLAADLGFDFVELKVSELYPEGPASSFDETRRKVEAAGIPARSFNFFLPPSLKIVGPVVDHQRIADYLGVTMERAAEIGGQVIVLGSGGARRVPDGFSNDQAREQFQSFATVAGTEAQKKGLVIALEPLNHTETNLMHTVADAVSIAQKIQHPAVGVIADVYHMMMGSEPFHHLMSVGDYLRHVHVCDAGRGVPGTRGFDLWGFFGYLNAIGYQGTVATECTYQSFGQEGRHALNLLRNMANYRGELSFSA